MFSDWQEALEAEGLPLNPTTTEQEAAAARVTARKASSKEDLVLLLDAIGLPNDDDTLTALLLLLPEDGEPDAMTTQTSKTPNAFEAMALSMHANGDSTEAIITATGLSEDELTELLPTHDGQEAPTAPAATTEPQTAADTQTLDPGSLHALLAWADEQPTAAVRNRAARIRSDWAELIQRRATDDAQRAAEERVATLKAELEKAQEELRAVKAGILPAPAPAPAPAPDTATDEPTVTETEAAAPTPIRSGLGSGRTKEELAAIRTWARANGHQVADKGIVAKKILDAYDAAHQAPAAKAS